jgi:hypothetical protein
LKKARVHIYIKGQSLIEIIVGITLGALIVSGLSASLFVGLRSNLQTREDLVASQLAQGLLDDTRVASEADWSRIYNLTKGVGNSYFTVAADGAIAATSGEESIFEKDITNGLVGYWKFDETAGTTAYDFSGNGKNGTLMNTPARATASSCKAGGCLNFVEAEQDYLYAPSVTSLSTNAISFGFWLKHPGIQTIYAHPLGIGGDHSAGCYFSKDLQNLNYKFASIGGSPYSAIIISNLDSSWHHVFVTYDGAAIKGYVDGALKVNNAASGTIAYIDNSVFIGTTGHTAIPNPILLNNYFSGYIDDVRIYNRALTADEISRVYKNRLFLRSFYAENVNRDADNGNISATGVDDPSTQKIVSRVSWQTLGGSREITLPAYITRNRNYSTRFTDWSGGSGIAGPITEPDSGIFYSSNIARGASSGSEAEKSGSTGTIRIYDFNLAANLIPATFDTGRPNGAAFNYILWRGVLNSDSKVKFQFATANCVNGATDPPTCAASVGWGGSKINGDGAFLGPSGSSGESDVYPTGLASPDSVIKILNQSTHNNKRYFRYKIFLESDPGKTQTPLVEDVIINWSP